MKYQIFCKIADFRPSEIFQKCLDHYQDSCWKMCRQTYKDAKFDTADAETVTDFHNIFKDFRFQNQLRYEISRFQRTLSIKLPGEDRVEVNARAYHH